MFFTFKVLFVLILLESSCCCFSFASQPISDSRCSAGVCAFNVLSDNLSISPCKGYSLIVAYGEASGTTMIQCSSPVEESKIFLYNRNGNDKKAYQFEGGRFFRSDSLPTLAAEGVPDKFTPVPLCNKHHAPNWGELIIAEKDVSDVGDPPYCYRINRVKESGDGLRIVMEDGRDLRPLSITQLKRWAKIRTLLSAYIPKNALQNPKSDVPANGRAIVQSTRAPLYSSSTPAAKTAKYLVKGDEVIILANGNDQAWAKIRYITKAGRVIEMWLQTRDLKVTP